MAANEFANLGDALKEVYPTKTISSSPVGGLSDDGTYSGPIYSGEFQVPGEWEESFRKGEWIKRLMKRPAVGRMVNQEAARVGVRSGVIRDEVQEMLWKLDYEDLTALDRPGIRNWVAVAGRMVRARLWGA